MNKLLKAIQIYIESTSEKCSMKGDDLRHSSLQIESNDLLPRKGRNLLIFAQEWLVLCVPEIFMNCSTQEEVVRLII